MFLTLYARRQIGKLKPALVAAYLVDILNFIYATAAMCVDDNFPTTNLYLIIDNSLRMMNLRQMNGYSLLESIMGQSLPVALNVP